MVDIPTGYFVVATGGSFVLGIIIVLVILKLFKFKFVKIPGENLVNAMGDRGSVTIGESEIEKKGRVSRDRREARLYAFNEVAHNLDKLSKRLYSHESSSKEVAHDISRASFYIERAAEGMREEFGSAAYELGKKFMDKGLGYLRYAYRQRKTIKSPTDLEDFKDQVRLLNKYLEKH